MADLKTKNASDITHKPRHRLEKSKNFRSSFLTVGALAAVMAIPSAAIPAYAAIPTDAIERASEVTPLDVRAIQRSEIVTADPSAKVSFEIPTVSSVRAEPEPEPEPEPVVEVEKKEATPEVAINVQEVISEQVDTGAALASPAAIVPSSSPSSSPSNAPVAVDTSSSSKAAAAVAAAYAELGVAQDCTDLVQNALAATGLTQRRDQGGFDRGPGIEQWDMFGTRVSLDNLAPGDILIYGHSHVALYVGNGQAIHGGFNGMNTVLFSATIPGQPLTGAVRI